MVDPITLTGLALAGLAGGAATAAMGGGGGTAATPTPTPAPTPASPASNPQGTAKKPQAQQQSFIGAAATPMNQPGQKTLLGQ